MYCSLENSDDKSIYVCEACLWKNILVIYTLSDKNDKMRKRHWSMRAFPCFVSFFIFNHYYCRSCFFTEKVQRIFSRKVCMFTRRNICVGMENTSRQAWVVRKRNLILSFVVFSSRTFFEITCDLSSLTFCWHWKIFGNHVYTLVSRLKLT